MIKLPKADESRIYVNPEKFNDIIEKVEDNLNILMSSIEAHRKIFVDLDKRLNDLQMENARLKKKLQIMEFQDDVDRGAFKDVRY